MPAVGWRLVDQVEREARVLHPNAVHTREGSEEPGSPEERRRGDWKTGRGRRRDRHLDEASPAGPVHPVDVPGAEHLCERPGPTAPAGRGEAGRGLECPHREHERRGEHGGVVQVARVRDEFHRLVVDPVARRTEAHGSLSRRLLHRPLAREDLAPASVRSQCRQVGRVAVRVVRDLVTLPEHVTDEPGVRRALEVASHDEEGRAHPRGAEQLAEPLERPERLPDRVLPRAAAEEAREHPDRVEVHLHRTGPAAGARHGAPRRTLRAAIAT
jgi:hypothetical protein